MKNIKIIAESEHAYDDAYHLLCEICEGVGDGRGVSIDELFEFFREVINDLPDECVRDMKGKELAKISYQLKKKQKRKAKVGDVIAVPVKRGCFALAVYLGLGRMGNAVGFLYPTLTKATPLSGADIERLNFKPLFSCYLIMDAVEAGKWKTVACAEEANLTGLFEGLPDVYYPKKFVAEDLSAGEFGVAQAEGGRRRNLTRIQAATVGVLDGSYRSIFFPAVISAYVERQIAIHEGRLDPLREG